MVSSADGLKLEIQRVFEADPSVVFRAFSDPVELARWWGPKGFAIPNLEFEPRIGHRYRIEMYPPPEGDPFYIETVVELSFRDLGGATELSMTQQPFKTEDRLALHWAGWTDSLDKLERVLSAQK